MNKNKGFIGIGLIVAIILGIVVVGGGAYYLGTRDTDITDNDNWLEQQENLDKQVEGEDSNNNLPDFATLPHEYGDNIKLLSFKTLNGNFVVETDYFNDNASIKVFADPTGTGIGELDPMTTGAFLGTMKPDLVGENVKWTLSGDSFKDKRTNHLYATLYLNGEVSKSIKFPSEGAFVYESIFGKTLDIKNWKTYTNTDCGYSFQYPDSWSQGNESNAINLQGTIMGRMIDFIDIPSQGIETHDGSNNQIYAPKDQMHIDCYTMGNAVYGDELTRYNNSSDIFSQTKKTINVGGQTAIVGEMRNTANISSGEHSGHTLIPTHSIYVFFLHKDQTRALYFKFNTPLGGNDNVEIAKFNQLLSTFKFITKGTEGLTFVTKNESPYVFPNIPAPGSSGYLLVKKNVTSDNLMYYYDIYSGSKSYIDQNKIYYNPTENNTIVKFGSGVSGNINEFRINVNKEISKTGYAIIRRFSDGGPSFISYTLIN